MSALSLYDKFISYLFETGDISVPKDYHTRCLKVTEMLDNDISGTINTILDYSINSASEVNYRIECSEPTLQKLLNLWLEKVNLEVRNIPTGLQALSKEYFRERWSGSSFIILRIRDWEPITADNVTIMVPMTMWIINGASIYVSRPKTSNYKLGSDKYFLDDANKIEIPKKDKDGKNAEEIIVQKPYNRWHDEYATPYLIRKGVYKNWLGMKTLQEKSDEVISKVLPYLFLIQAGSDTLEKDGIHFEEPELIELADNFKNEIEKYKSQKGKTPTNAVPHSVKYQHIIPDLGKILSEELYHQGYRAILAGLGFIDMVEISPSRQEARMNPKAFVSEINEGISGFKQILLETIYIIEKKNKPNHSKLFTDKGNIIIVNSPLRINIESILADLRSGFDRGPMSIQSYQEMLGLDPTTEKQRRLNELANGDEELFYPHIISNQEEKGTDIKPSKPKSDKQEKLEDENKKPNSPETKTKTAEIENLEEAVTQEELTMAPYDKDNPPIFLKKYPKEARDAFIETFNKLLKEGKPEEYCFPIAWNSLKRVMKKLKNKEADNE